MTTEKTLTASALLTHFQFPPKKQYDQVAKLSGGEKRRLQLLCTLVENPNFLILDEPTNDFDILTLNTPPQVSQVHTPFDGQNNLILSEDS